MEKSKYHKLLELQQNIKLLKLKNARLEKELELMDMKADFFRHDDIHSRKGIKYRHTKKILS